MPHKIAPPFRYFIDECLGLRVRAAVKNALLDDEEVYALTDHFARGTKDEVWLRAVGERSWVVLTMDGKLRYRPNEREALISANVAVFMVKVSTGDAMADRVTRAMPQIRTAVRSGKVPLIGTILDSGGVNLLVIGGKDSRRSIKPPGGTGRHRP